MKLLPVTKSCRTRKLISSLVESETSVKNSSNNQIFNLFNHLKYRCTSFRWKRQAQADTGSEREKHSYENLDFDDEIDFATRARIENIIQENKIVLFMKGNKLFPGCGFSGTAVRILESLNVEFKDVDVGADFRLKEELKRYTEWPTIPQLYLQGEFIGGADIMIEMYQTGELQESIEIAAAS